ncbi:hypothetical protein [Niveispirillum cyanobacteriorum]|nr:hypothetical protein [Niveispirillum cyanobacteriorum]
MPVRPLEATEIVRQAEAFSRVEGVADATWTLVPDLGRETERWRWPR